MKFGYLIFDKNKILNDKIVNFVMETQKSTCTFVYCKARNVSMWLILSYRYFSNFKKFAKFYLHPVFNYIKVQNE